MSDAPSSSMLVITPTPPYDPLPGVHELGKKDTAEDLSRSIITLFCATCVHFHQNSDVSLSQKKKIGFAFTTEII
jgi:hypothetical protein